MLGVSVGRSPRSLSEEVTDLGSDLARPSFQPLNEHFTRVLQSSAPVWSCPFGSWPFLQLPQRPELHLLVPGHLGSCEVGEHGKEMFLKGWGRRQSRVLGTEVYYRRMCVIRAGDRHVCPQQHLENMLTLLSPS